MGVKGNLLKDVLNSDVIQIRKNIESWEKAIKVASEPLIANNTINHKYVTSMINNVQELGPYIVIAPDVAIAHARPEENIKKIGLSLLKLDESINFAENSHYASLIFVLAAVDNDQHLELLSELAEVLGDNGKVAQLKKAKTINQIQSLIN